MRRALALVVFVATGCGVAASVPAPKPPTIPLSSSVPPTPSAPPTPSSPPAPRAAIVVGNERGVFLPDGRLAVQLAHGQYVTTPERPEQGEIVPFEGTLHVAGARVFGIASAAGRFRFVELDAQLHEVRGIDLGKMPLVGMTADGEYLVLRRAGKALLVRTRDFSTVVEGVHAVFDGRSLFALVPTSLDGRYAVGATQVVDLEKGKIVFSHSALPESAWLIEKGRFHWVFSDLLETVDLELDVGMCRTLREEHVAHDLRAHPRQPVGVRHGAFVPSRFGERWNVGGKDDTPWSLRNRSVEQARCLGCRGVRELLDALHEGMPGAFELFDVHEVAHEYGRAAAEPVPSVVESVVADE